MELKIRSGERQVCNTVGGGLEFYSPLAGLEPPSDPGRNSIHIEEGRDHTRQGLPSGTGGFVDPLYGVLKPVQAVLGGISLSASEFKGPDSQLTLEAFSVFRHIGRIARGAEFLSFYPAESHTRNRQLWLRSRLSNSQED